MSTNENDILKAIEDYGTDSIDSLEGLEAVRKRPGMYIGTTSQRGVNQLIWEVTDNSVDEFVGGFGNKIDVKVDKDGTVTVVDRGRGIPVGPHKKWRNQDGTPMETLIGILTKLHSGGKYQQANTGYKVSAGLHGVGAKATNALSDTFEVWVKRGGKVYYSKFHRGEPESLEAKVIGSCPITETGTTIKYTPDKTIFTQTVLPDPKAVMARMDELAALNAGLTFEYADANAKIENKIFYRQDGIAGYVKEMVKSKDGTEIPLLYDEVFHFKGEYTYKVKVEKRKENGEVEFDSSGKPVMVDVNQVTMVEIAYIHDDDIKASETIRSFANNVNTHDGGYHYDGFRNSIAKFMNTYAQNNKMIDGTIERKYLLDGIHAVVSVKVPEAEFEGQTKSKLGSEIAKVAVETVFNQQMEKLIKDKKYQAIVQSIVTRAISVKEAEEKARISRALIRKGKQASKMGLPGKLMDCSSKGYSELFIVEGDSAAGSAKLGRDGDFQALLPLRGKVLNIEKADLEKMLKSDAIKSIIAAMGTGFGRDFDIKKARYDKLIIMTDADNDGFHIRLLIITLIWRYMRGLIEQGMVYLTSTPLYKYVHNKKVMYFANDREWNEFAKKNPKVDVTQRQRFKGLGEMNPEQLWETAMNPETRTLFRITIEDVEEAQRMIDIMMGVEVGPRRDFIELHAHEVNIHDIG